MNDPITVLAWLGFGAAVIASAYFVIRMRREFQEGKWWTGIVVEGRRLNVGIDHQLCMGAASCVELAPDIFRLDWSKRKSTFDPAPLEQSGDANVNPDKVYLAAQSCPYRAIYIEDYADGSRVFP